jgi:hypothetical protein
MRKKYPKGSLFEFPYKAIPFWRYNSKLGRYELFNEAADRRVWAYISKWKPKVWECYIYTFPGQSTPALSFNTTTLKSGKAQVMKRRRHEQRV